MDLSDRRQLMLERPDLSALESVTLVLAYATEGIRKLPDFMLSIAGAGDGSAAAWFLTGVGRSSRAATKF